MTRRRGFLVKPDPALTERCARPQCGQPEGVHLICGVTAGDYDCPGFALPAPTCPDCRREFGSPWQLVAHRLIRPAACLHIARHRAVDDARRQQRRGKAGV